MPAQEANDDRLNGWKEIAACLGKGVRTVQRWELEFGLPVHRLGKQGGEIVWASRRELNHWYVHNAALTKAARTPQPMANVPEPVPGVPASRPTRTSHRVIAGLILISVLLLAGAAVRTALNQSAGPVAWDFRSGQFTVLDRDGKKLFARNFNFMAQSAISVETESREGGRVVMVDLDGDGINEVLAALSGGQFVSQMGLLAYDAHGTELFAVRPEQRVTFGHRTYAGPWMPYHLFIEGDGPSLSIFAVFIGSLDFPSLLLELDSRGRVVSEYWSNGYIESLIRVPWRDGTALMVGATHNDTRNASLAVFETGHAAGAAPALQQEYRCTSCPPERPSEFLLFPRRALAKAIPGGAGQATVQQIRVEQDGKIRVNVTEGLKRNNDGLYWSMVWYTLDRSLTPLEALLSSSMLEEHARLFGAGQLSSPWGAADEMALYPVRRWQQGNFIDLPPGKIAR